MTSGREATRAAAVPGVVRSAARVSTLNGRPLRHRRRDDVDQRGAVDRLAGDGAVGDQPLGQLDADHAGGADDENAAHSAKPPSAR